MQHDHDIITRFYMAVDALYALGEINRIRAFEREIGANHTSFYRQRHNLDARSLRPSWLRHLVYHYGISADWLLLGEGKMFR